MSKCEHCGCDPYQARQADRFLDRSHRLERELERQAAAHAVEIAKWRVAELDRRDDHKGFQRKVSEQRRTINRLEAKLRKLGVPPYAPEVAPCNECSGVGGHSLRCTRGGAE
ncbi:hypothetical protein [Nocardia wallacei]|uniref:hypothetical protein n=1 Tax=Nocardia wallacei TaxID=480035 RepID=UPI002458472A|nr:hypothetical protein [Nocardia wallacei]